MKKALYLDNRNSANITVITVCYNAEREIEKTLQSVLNQTVTGFEYLVIDGLSKDKTGEIANAYMDSFSKKGINYKVSSAKDNGIYNAMNKGAKMASRNWLIYLNAGDYFANERVLESVNKYYFDDYDIVYGDSIEELDTPSRLRKIMKARPLEMIKNGMVFCHQSTFIRKEKLLELPYDETYRIAGDFNFFYGSYRKGFSFRHIDEIIAVFTLGGASSNPADHVVEDAKVKYTWGTLSQEEYDKVIIQTYSKKKLLVMREKIKSRVPKPLLNKIQEYKYKRLGFQEDI